MEDLSCREYRLAAKSQCSEYSNTLALIYLVYGAIVSILTASSFGILGVLVLGPLNMGLAYICKQVDKKGEVDLEKLFDGFKQFGSAVVLELLLTLYLVLWSLLIIPVFIKIYSYSMAYFIQQDNPDMSANDCITESRRIMNGNKWKLFCLDLSYLGWIILCILTFGILIFWVSPKMQQAKYLFYLHITGKDQVVVEE